MFLVSLLVLGILVFVHELGHFLFAKYYGVGVLEFAIGFGPLLGSFTRGDTKYSIRAIPLGGFVRMVGENPGAAKEALEGEEVSAVERRLIGDSSRWFINKSLKARALIVFAGPLFNILFAWLVAFGTIYYYGAGEPLSEPIVGEVIPDYPAEKAGVLKGDRIVSINGIQVSEWKQIRDLVAKTQGQSIQLVLERPKGDTKEMLQLSIQGKETGPEVDYVAGTGEGKKGYMIGLIQGDRRIPVSLSQAALYGSLHTGGAIWMNVRSILGLLKGIIGTENLGGPVMIFQEAARTARKGLEPLLNFMVFLSVSLAVLNLLPVPVLDGGHLTFFLLEAIRGGKPVSIRVQEYAMRVGMTLLLFLMVYALRNDIRRFFL